MVFDIASYKITDYNYVGILVNSLVIYLSFDNLHAHFENLHRGSHKDLLCKLTLNIWIGCVILQRV